MTATRPTTVPARHRRPPPRRRSRRIPGWVPRLLVLLAVFAVGIALGEALHDNPTPGPARTHTRSLQPLPLAPARVTVTAPAT